MGNKKNVKVHSSLGAGVFLVHYPVFFRLHHLAHRENLRSVQAMLTLGGLIHLMVAPYSRVREFHEHLLSYIAGRGEVGDLLSLMLTSTRALQLIGERDRVQRTVEILTDVLSSQQKEAPADIYFFERDTGLLTWFWDADGRTGSNIVRAIAGRRDIGEALRGISVGTNDVFTMPSFGDGRPNPIQGLIDGLGVAGDCVDPMRPGLKRGAGGVIFDPHRKVGSIDLGGLELGPSGSGPCVPLPVEKGWRPLLDPSSPPDADPSLETQGEFDQALRDVLGEPAPPLTKEEQDQLLATPAPEPSGPAPEKTTPEDIDKMIGNTPTPDDVDGPKGPAYFPQPDGGSVGGPSGRFLYPAREQGDGGMPRWRFFFPKPDDVGPGGPSGLSLTSTKSIEKTLRKIVGEQHYFPKSGSVFLPKITNAWSRTGANASLVGARGSKAIGCATFVFRIGNGGRIG